jgi:hypothetical protein
MVAMLIFLILFLAIAWLWLKQFVWLMMLDDKTFPGKYDKLIWGAAFVFLFVLAPFAFIMWKSAIEESPNPTQNAHHHTSDELG